RVAARRRKRDGTSSCPARSRVRRSRPRPDLSQQPLERRETALAKLLRRSHDGIQLVGHIEAPGDVLFARACGLGLEGIVSKRRDMPYQHGRSREWLKVKNTEHPAMTRVWEEKWLQ